MGKLIIEEFSVRPQAGREVGIEIEMEGDELPAGPNGWITTSDGSLRGPSCEWVLERPVKQHDAYILLDRLEDTCRQNNANLRPSDRCGVHIHVNVQEMTTEEVIKFCLLYLVLEDLLVGWCGEDREGNLFCLRAVDAEFIVNAVYEAQFRGSFKKVVNHDIRYASLNLTSLDKYGSLEFRALRTPPTFDRIKTWISMLMEVKKAAEHFTSTEQIIESISLRGGKWFLRSVFPDNHREFDHIDGINDIIIRGARRVQDIAYISKFKPKKKQGLEGFDFSYWHELRRIKGWCSGQSYQFVRYDPWEGQLHIIAKGKNHKFDWPYPYDADTLPDLETITSEHQMDDVLINARYEATGLNRGNGARITGAVDNYWQPGDDEEFNGDDFIEEDEEGDTGN